MQRVQRSLLAAVLIIAAGPGISPTILANERPAPTNRQATAAGEQTIYWGDEVPAGWNGQWPETLRTVPERTDFTRTMSTLQLHEYIVQLKLASENVHVVSMFTSPLRKVAPAIVLATPRVTSPRQARESGKPVVFLMGNIHPPESEAAEALLMVARDLAAGPRRALLDNLIETRPCRRWAPKRAG